MSKTKVIRVNGFYSDKHRRRNKLIAAYSLSAVLGICAGLFTFFNFYNDGQFMWNVGFSNSDSSDLAVSSQGDSDKRPSNNGSPDNSSSADNSSKDSEKDPNKIPDLVYDENSKGYFGDGDSKVYMFEDVAYEMFYGDKSTAAQYSDAINFASKKLKAILGKDTKIYDMVIPTRTEFTLPDSQKLKASTFSQIKNIQAIGEKLDKDIKLIDVTQTLLKHRDEYIFFNTDSFWNARGAYYAYAQFMGEISLKPTPLSELEKSTNKVEGYLGGLYRAVKDNKEAEATLKKNKDTVEYFDIPGDITVKSIYNDGTSEYTGLYYPSPSTEYAYALFLYGGEHPVMDIKTKVANGKKLLVIKDSAGNCLVPYLAMNYEEIIVIDYKYFDSNIEDLLAKSKIKEVLFLNGIMDANTEIRTNSIKGLFS